MVMEVDGYKQTEIGLIPDNWEVNTLEKLCNRIGDGIHATPKYDDNGDYFFINGNNLNAGQIELSEVTRKVSKIDYAIHKRDLNDSTILFSINGTIGNIAFYNNEKILIGKSAAYLNTNCKIEKKFLYQILQAKFIKEYFEDGLTGSTIKNLGLNVIRFTPIPLPPTKAEQNAIATALSDTDNYITHLEKLIAKKRLIKQGAMQKLLKPKEGWEVKRLGDCLLKNPEYGINAAASDYSDNLPTYIRITDISASGYFQPERKVSVNHPLSSNYYLEKGDMVFARTGASVGKAYLYNENDGALVFAGFLIRIKPNPDILNPLLLKALTESKPYWDWVKLMSMRSGQPGINGNEYKQFQFYLPSSIQKQAEISTIFSGLESEIIKLEKQLLKAQNVKQGMMQQLLTGKIRLV